MSAGFFGWLPRVAARVVLGALILPALASAAGPVLVVRSSDLGPYREVEQSFLRAIGEPIQVVSLTAPNGAAALQQLLSQGPKGVLLIGKDAVTQANASNLPSVVVTALVPENEVPPLAVAIPPFAPPERQLAALKQLVPALKKVGLVYDPGQSAHRFQEYQAAAAAQKVALTGVPVTDRKDVAQAVKDLLSRVDALWLMPDTTVVNAASVKFILEHSLSQKVPVIAFSQAICRAGGLLATEADPSAVGRRAAELVRRMAAGNTSDAGAVPGDLFINARTASALGLTVPAQVRARAAQVFE